MAILDATTFAGALKTLYPDWALENMVFKNNPFLALVNKDENFKGDQKKIPVIIGAPQNTSADFSVAANSGSALATSSTIKAFFLTRVRKYALAEISNEVMKASEGNEGAFIEAVKLEVDGAIRSLSNQLAFDVFQDGSGVVGQLTATSGVTTSITLADPTQATMLEIGMPLRFSTVNTGASLKTGTLRIAGINRVTGVVTLDASGATLTPVLAVNDYVLISGNQAAGMKGLAAWIPSTAPTSGDSFFGVDRSVDSRLFGIYVDKSATPIEEAILDADMLVATAGGSADTLIVNPVQYAALAKSLGSRIIFQQLKVGGVGFQTFEIQGQNGPIKVLSDRGCPKTDGYLLSLEHLKMCTLGKIVEVYSGDGLQMLRSTTSDSVRVQVNHYGNLACTAPGWQCRIKLA